VTTKFEELKTFLTGFGKEVVQPGNKQSGGPTWKKVQAEMRGFHNVLKGYVNTLTQINKELPVKAVPNIKNIVDYVNKGAAHAKAAANYKWEHGAGGAKQRSVFGVKDEAKRVALCTLFETRINDAKAIVQGWTSLAD